MSEPALDMSEIMGLYKEDARQAIRKMDEILKSQWAELVQGGIARQNLRRISHQLRGSGRTYGFRLVTSLAKAMENIVLKFEKGSLVADDRAKASLSRKVEQLARIFES